VQFYPYYSKGYLSKLIKTKEIKEAIFGLSILEKNLQIWARIFEPLSEIQNELRIAKDYLLQVYEFE